jgi:hypothetical protein
MVTVRPARIEDSAALVAFLESLSPDAANRRFNGPLPRMSTSLLHRLLGAVDGVSAWVALDPSGAVVGHAMIAETSDPTHVEFAVVVTDGWQHAGVGHLLAARVREAVRALAPYDPVVELVVHPANRPAMDWAARAVAAARGFVDASDVRLELLALH